MSSPAYLFSADRALFAEMKGSLPLLDIPSHEGFGAVNPNEEVAGLHAPSISCATLACKSPTVARSFMSFAAMPFFRGRQSKRLIAATGHFDIASFGRYCFFSTLFLFFYSVQHFHF